MRSGGCIGNRELLAQSIRGKRSTPMRRRHSSPRATGGATSMDPVIAIAFWAALFVPSHLLISSQSIREGLVNRIGEMPFRGLYSLAALGTLIPLMMIFFRHKHAGAMLWYLRDFIAV